MNPYTQLDISLDASLEEIKQRFRTLAHLHHPDKGGNEEVFKSIKLAYEILMDPIRRKQYDLTGDAEIANIRDEAVTNIVQIILSIIPTFDPDQDDLIEIAKHKTNDMLTRENNQIANIQRDINNFEKDGFGEIVVSGEGVIPPNDIIKKVAAMFNVPIRDFFKDFDQDAVITKEIERVKKDIGISWYRFFTCNNSVTNQVVDYSLKCNPTSYKNALVWI